MSVSTVCFRRMAISSSVLMSTVQALPVLTSEAFGI